MELRNKKILYIVKTLDVGGAERFTFNLCKHFVNAFSQVAVFSSGGIFEEELKKIGVKIFLSNLADKRGILNFFRLRRELKKILYENNFDLIHCQHRYFVPMIKSLKQKNFKLIYTSNNYFNDLLQYLLFPDVAVAISNSIFENLKKTLLLKKDKIRLINYGVEVSKYEIKMSNNYALGFVGRLIIEKGILELAEAFKILSASYPNIKLIYRGKGKDLPSLTKYIGDNNLIDKVKIDEPSDDLVNVYKDIDILVLPSKMNEGLPISILEAMSKGILIVATNVGAINDVLINYKTGVILESPFANELVQKISSLLDNKDIIGKIRKEAIDLVRKNYNIDNLFLRYEELYFNVIHF